jgi:peptide/nickel transport system substrate-binding protein
MDTRELADWIGQVKSGAISRRQFTRMMLGLGLTGPVVSQLLAASGVAQAQTRAGFTPARRGGGGPLRVLWWGPPTNLNPHFAVGERDKDGARIFYEPLAAYAADGSMLPILAAEIPTLQNGGVAKDGTSVTWRLKKGVTWHDGAPVTADDVVFNWEYAVDPAAAAVTSGQYKDITRIDKLDSHTVKIVFHKPSPFWSAFCGPNGMIIPKHQFESFKGAKSREAPANFKPVGTGPYLFVDFKAGDMIRGAINPKYHVANWPFFDTIELKGGGDAVSAARAVIQTGEFDFGWNIQVEDEILKRMEQGGKGKVDIAMGGNIELIECNQTDPGKEVDGERSSVKAPHPFLTDRVVRSALNLLIDRSSIQEQIYGRAGITTANVVNAPPRFQSKNMKWEFNVDKANKLLDDAGWKRGPDGVRAKDGKRLRLLYQTSTNAPRQKTQAIVKQAAAKAGIEIEIKAVAAASFFASDPANWDTYSHFAADIQMYTTVMNQPDPQRFVDQFTSWEVASKANKWSGRNITRWRNDEYDRLWKSAESEMDPVKRAALFIRMNDLLVQNAVVIPVVWRPFVAAISNKLKGAEQSGWDSNFWQLAYWYTEA